MLFHDFFDALRRRILTTIIDYQDLELRIVASEQSEDSSLDNLFFIVGRYEYRYRWGRQELSRKMFFLIGVGPIHKVSEKDDPK